jgi:hypothetical protein
MLQQKADLEVYMEITKTWVYTQADFALRGLKFCSLSSLLH